MSYTIERIGTNKVTIRFVVNKEICYKTFAKVYEEAAKNVKMPGFRTGKVPLAMLDPHLLKSIEMNAAEEMMTVAYSEAAEKEKLIAYKKPTFHYNSVKEDEAFTFTAEVVLQPIPVIGQYKGLELSAVDIIVDEQSIDNKIKELMAKLDNSRNIDAPIQSGDIVKITFKCTVDGEAFAGGSAENYSMAIESGVFIPGFVEQLIGHKAGDIFNLNLTFPHVYYNEELQGKDALFNVEIKEVHRDNKRELNDQTIKEVSEFETIQELREAIREQLEKENQYEAKKYLEMQAIEKLLSVTEVEIPIDMVEEKIEVMIANMKANIARRGLKFEDHLKNTGRNINILREQLRVEAEKEIKSDIALIEVAKKEDIKVTQEINSEISALATMIDKSADDVIKMLVKEGSYQVFVFSLLRKKTTQFLIDNAVIN